MRDLDRSCICGLAWETEIMRTCLTHDASISDSPRKRQVGSRFVQASLLVLWIVTGLGAADVSGQTRAYVASCVDTVAVLDVTTNELITTIPVGSSPSAVAITPDGSRAYVTNFLDTVSVVDIATNAMIETISVGFFPRDVAITPDGSRAYVANTFSDTLSVIDTATNQVIDTITGLADPAQVAITPDGSRAYVAHQDVPRNAVSVIDTVSNTVIASIPIPTGLPRDVAITPDGSRVYVPDFVGAVWVIETATNTIVAGIEGLSSPESVAITPDGTRAYVTQLTTDNVAVIDTATNAVVATIGLGRFSLPREVEITPNGSRVYVTGSLASSPVWVIDSVSNSLIATITSIDCPKGIAFTPSAIPTNKEQCKRGGWRNFGPPAGPFRNQGQCISFVLHNEQR